MKKVLSIYLRNIDDSPYRSLEINELPSENLYVIRYRHSSSKTSIRYLGNNYQIMVNSYHTHNKLTFMYRLS
jgi:hypothetical protein